MTTIPIYLYSTVHLPGSMDFLLFPLSMDGAFWSLLASLLSTNSITTCFYVLSLFISLSLSHPFFQVDSVDNFTPSNTPSRDEDSKKSRSRSPSMASDVEPIEVNADL